MRIFGDGGQLTSDIIHDDDDDVVVVVVHHAVHVPSNSDTYIQKDNLVDDIEK